jgi:hypothetical protein
LGNSADFSAGDRVPIIPAEPDVLFEMNVGHTVAASAVTVETQVGAKYGMVSSAHKAYCQIDDASTLCFRVFELKKDDVVGTQYGRVLCRVLSDVYQLSAGEKTP